MEKARVRAPLGCSHTGYEFQQERAEIQGVYNSTLVQPDYSIFEATNIQQFSGNYSSKMWLLTFSYSSNDM